MIGFFSRPHKLNILINHKVCGSFAVLKFICAMLDFIDYKHFEGLIRLTQSTFQVEKSVLS